jgi:hypothetical protein
MSFINREFLFWKERGREREGWVGGRAGGTAGRYM